MDSSCPLQNASTHACAYLPLVPQFERPVPTYALLAVMRPRNSGSRHAWSSSDINSFFHPGLASITFNIHARRIRRDLASTTKAARPHSAPFADRITENDRSPNAAALNPPPSTAPASACFQALIGMLRERIQRRTANGTKQRTAMKRANPKNPKSTFRRNGSSSETSPYATKLNGANRHAAI